VVCFTGVVVALTFACLQARYGTASACTEQWIYVFHVRPHVRHPAGLLVRKVRGLTWMDCQHRARRPCLATSKSWQTPWDSTG
jgi:hypothetical protein